PARIGEAAAAPIERESRDAGGLEHVAGGMLQPVGIERVRDERNVDGVIRMELAPVQHHALEEVELPRVARSLHASYGGVMRRKRKGGGVVAHALIAGPSTAARSVRCRGNSGRSARRARR